MQEEIVWSTNIGAAKDFGEKKMPPLHLLQVLQVDLSPSLLQGTPCLWPRLGGTGGLKSGFPDGEKFQ